MPPGADPHLPIVYGQGYTKICKLCGDRIWMVPQRRRDLRPGQPAWFAVDLERRHDGNITIDEFGRAYVAGADEDLDGAELFIAHQATCKVYLEQRAAERQTRLDIDG